MSTSGIEYSAIRMAVTDWQALSGLMARSETDLRSASTGGLAPTVQGAANTFLQKWAGFAGESSAIGQGFADALTAASDDFLNTDRSVDEQFAHLDGRLGPER